MSKFNIEKIESMNDVYDLSDEFILKVMNALEIGTTKDEKVLSDIAQINTKLAIDNLEIKQTPDYLNRWKLFSSYGEYLRGAKEYDSVKKWYNGKLTKEQLDNALEVMDSFKETFIKTIDTIQDDKVKKELSLIYKDIYLLFSIKGLKTQEIEEYDNAKNKETLVDSLVEKSNNRTNNIQTQKDEMDIMDSMYKPILDGFNNNYKELKPSEEKYLKDHNLELRVNGSDIRDIRSLNLDYIKDKYGSKAAKIVKKGTFAEFNEKKLKAAVPFMKNFFGFKITGLGNNEDFYTTNTQYGALKGQIEHHLALKGLLPSDISYIKKNDFTAKDIIGKAKVNRAIQNTKNKVKDAIESVNKKDVKSALKSIHKSLKLLKDINKGKYGVIASKDYEALAKDVLKETNIFVELTRTNNTAMRSLNWFNRRELNKVNILNNELKAQIKVEEPKVEVVNENDNDLRRSVVINIDEPEKLNNEPTKENDVTTLENKKEDIIQANEEPSIGGMK